MYTRMIFSAFMLVTLSIGLVSCGKNKTAPRVIIRGMAWQVEVASDTPSRRKGLAGREYISDDRGMLFVFAIPQEQTFWMQGCVIPIDVAFIDENMTVVKIHAMKVEVGGGGIKRYHSDKPVLYALEVRGGLLAEIGVKEGDKVTFTRTIPKGSE